MSVDRAARAGTWSALDVLLRQLVQFVVSIILARLLSPGDFGLIALLGFFTSLSIVFVQGGLSTALVRHQGGSYEEENAVFWTNLLAGIAFATLLIVIAPWVARFYGYPLLAPLMFVAAAQVVLSALGAVQTAILERSVRFDQLMKTGVISSALSGATGVGAALAGWGVWALATQLLVGAASSLAALWWLCDWRPSWRVRFGAVRGLARFGAHISASSTLEIIHSNGFQLVIGKMYGVGDLGIWNRASAVTLLPTGVVSQIVSRTALPLFAERVSDPEALRRGFRMAISLSMLISLPLMVGLSLLSDLIVRTLYGPKWLPAAPILSVMALGVLLLPLQSLNLQLLLAQGGSRTFLRIEVQKKLVGIPILAIGCVLGVMGLAWATVIYGVLSLIINTAPTGKSLGYGIGAQFKDLGTVFAAAGVMAAGVMTLKAWLVLPAPLALAVLTGAGGVLYFGFGLACRSRSFVEAWSLGGTVLANITARLRRARA